MVSASGYPSVAKGIAEASVGRRSEKEWSAIMQATSHQLIMKRIWDEERESRGENPLNEELHNLVEKYVQSGRMIRCSNAPERTSLMLHHYEGDDWLFHLIDRDIIHEFALISSNEIRDVIREYYGITYDAYQENLSFNLTYQDFEQLSNPNNVDKIKGGALFTLEEETSFEMFLEDLNKLNWRLFNITNFSMEGPQDDASPENIIFFLPSTRGVWVSEHHEDSERPVNFYLAGKSEWDEWLESIERLAKLQTT